MVHDALQEMEEKGITPDQAWMDELKGASGTAFLGTQVRGVCEISSLIHAIEFDSCSGECAWKTSSY